MTHRVVLSSHRFAPADDHPAECRHCGRRPSTHPTNSLAREMIGLGSRAMVPNGETPQ
jgi:hypothetical protein